MKGDLTVERFPEELRQEGKVSAIRLGQTWREFVIDAVAARIAWAQAQQREAPGGPQPPAGSGTGASPAVRGGGGSGAR
jgi:hypothetical protein